LDRHRAPKRRDAAAMSAKDRHDWKSVRSWLRSQLRDNQHATLDLLEDGDPAHFWASASVRTLSRGEPIFLACQRADRVSWIQSGSARIYGISPHGRTVTYWYGRAGQFIGLAEVLTQVDRQVYAEAHETVVVLEIEREYFNELLQRGNPLVHIVLEQLSTRLRRSCDATLALATAPVRSRLAHLLLLLFGEECDELKARTALSELYSQQELADMIGTSRQATNEALAELRSCGAIAVERGRLVLVDAAMLVSYE
jgi:CRP/FNR family cyclic AMP-dependent transcriptional regulator